MNEPLVCVRACARVYARRKFIINNRGGDLLAHMLQAAAYHFRRPFFHRLLWSTAAEGKKSCTVHRMKNRIEAVAGSSAGAACVCFAALGADGWPVIAHYIPTVFRGVATAT